MVGIRDMLVFTVFYCFTLFLMYLVNIAEDQNIPV